MELRKLGQTDICVTPVALGCWPITGMTSLDVNQRDSIATLEAAIDTGLNFFDTAYLYGEDGQSERLIHHVLGHRRDDIVIATKGGLHWQADGSRAKDARPDTLRRQCEQSLLRLNTDHVDLLYLHAPDPHLPVAESAGGLRELMEQGKARSIGASNLTVTQLEEFHAACPLSAVQPPYNMLQRQIEADLLPWCRQRNVSVAVYWPLLKGLLAGKLARDHNFLPGDGRAKYPMFHGEEWQKNQDFVDDLRDVARQTGKTVSQVVINWTIHQPGITAALCGAKRACQIRETAQSVGWKLSPENLELIDKAFKRRGTPNTQTAI